MIQELGNKMHGASGVSEEPLPHHYHNFWINIKQTSTCMFKQHDSHDTQVLGLLNQVGIIGNNLTCIFLELDK